jgi:hypothetical protein
MAMLLSWPCPDLDRFYRIVALPAGEPLDPHVEEGLHRREPDGSVEATDQVILQERAEPANQPDSVALALTQTLRENHERADHAHDPAMPVDPPPVPARRKGVRQVTEGNGIAVQAPRDQGLLDLLGQRGPAALVKALLSELLAEMRQYDAKAPLWIDVADVTSLFGVDAAKLRNWVENGFVRKAKLGETLQSRSLYSAEDINEVLHRISVGQQPVNALRKVGR